MRLCCICLIPFFHYSLLSLRLSFCRRVVMIDFNWESVWKPVGKSPVGRLCIRSLSKEDGTGLHHEVTSTVFMYTGKCLSTTCASFIFFKLCIYRLYTLIGISIKSILTLNRYTCLQFEIEEILARVA